MSICQFPNCKNKDVQQHHVTYVSKESGLQPHITYLCKEHHSKITALNYYNMRRSIWTGNNQLTNSMRIDIYKEWISGAILVATFAEAAKLKIQESYKVNLDEARNS